MSKTSALKRLLNPRTIAVFGGDAVEEVITQCVNAGYKGKIWAVNPNRETLGGIPCVTCAADLPEVPDACFVAAPPKASIEIIRELAKMGVAGTVCYTAGFAEIGDSGSILQFELKRAAGDMPLIGPNCHGFLNYFDGVTLWPDQHGGHRVERGVAIVLQSGNLAINLTMQQRSLSLGYVISIGNKASLGYHDYIEMLIDDPRVTAIGLHIESISNIHKFSIAAIKALQAGIPIVAIKSGRSVRGAEITLSHTASLAGSDTLYSALFRRLGIARCDTAAEFLETLKFLSIAGVLANNTLGSMSCSGGEASLIADRAELLSLQMPILSEQSKAKLLTTLGSKIYLSNPLDYHTYAWGDYEKLNLCFRAMLENQFACTILVLDYPLTENRATDAWEISERALVDAAIETGQLAVVVATLPETLPASARARLIAANIAPMQGLEECLFAIRAAFQIGNAQRNVKNILPVHPVESVQQPIVSLDEWESKAELAAAGLRIPSGELSDRDKTSQVADRLGYPVVLKAVSSALPHKSESGSVVLNLPDAEAVRLATHGMMPNFNQFLLEKMITTTVVEVIIGVHRDPAFGLSLVLGSGGTLVEILDDCVSLLLPLQRHEIDEAIGSLKLAKILDGYRGSASGDYEALVDAVVKVAEYALAHNGSLVELDINPLIVMSEGVVAADAFIRKGVS